MKHTALARAGSLVLACALSLSLCPASAHASDSTSYIERTWDESKQCVISTGQTVEGATSVAAKDASWGKENETSWYVVDSNIENENRIEVKGDVRLILADGCSLAAHEGIHVPADAELTIYGQSDGDGALVALPTEGSAAIGGTAGSDDGNSGQITIQGATVTATGAEDAAAIGGGQYGDGHVAITGGNVLANNTSDYGVGIGGGIEGTGYVTVSGGATTASGRGNTAAIGGSGNEGGAVVSITGGEVTANAEDSSAGIGAPENGNVDIRISGGTVSASAENAGIGIGASANGSGTISITGGVVNAEADDTSGYGIGGTTVSFGDNGHAVVFASSLWSRSVSGTPSGIIFVGSFGTVYGNQTLSTGMEIPTGSTLTVDSDATLTIAAGTTLTNNGTIRNLGAIVNSGTVLNSGTIYSNTPISGVNDPLPLPVSTFYVTPDGQTNSVASATLVKDDDTTWGSSGVETWYVVEGTIENGNRIEVKGNVHLILADGCSLNATKGIRVPQDSSLSIYGQTEGNGTLIAFGASYDAGIGGKGNGNGYNDSESNSGSISIYGGTVRASACNSGAGIGGGDGGNGTVYIYDGTVEASSKTAASIGGGVNGTGTVEIHGGTVTAKGTGEGPGIGGGKAGGSTVTITGGVVKASSVDGAGIGGGTIEKAVTDKEDAVSVTITGGTVEATSDNGAGIGSGKALAEGTDADSAVTVTISGGTVTAQSQTASGIGDGTGRTGSSFGTGENGAAVIFASSVSDISQKNSWSGIIFVGNDGSVYGDQVLSEDLEIPVDHSLTVNENTTLTVGAGATLTISGTLANEGTIVNKGTIVNEGIVSGFGKLQGEGTVNKGKQTAPSLMRAISVTTNSVTLEAVQTSSPCPVEYARTAEGSAPDSWQASPVFSGLDPATSYTFYARLSGNAWYEASPASSGLTVRTEVPSEEPSTPSTPPSRPTYTPTVKPTEGGETTISPSRPHKGETVHVKPTPADGWEVENVIVTDKDGNSLEVTRNENGDWTFTQPSGKVTIEVVFQETTPEPLPFTDIPAGAWYEDAVRYAWEHGLMTGVGDGEFAPDAMANRGMAATILWRMAGEPAAESDPAWPDADLNAYYGPAARWAALAGIVCGYDDGRFGPGDPVTREQFAVLLYRFAQMDGRDATARGDLGAFADNDQVSDWAREAMEWAVSEGVIKGVDGTALLPGSAATRAEMAAMLERFCSEGASDTPTDR